MPPDPIQLQESAIPMKGDLFLIFDLVKKAKHVYAPLILALLLLLASSAMIMASAAYLGKLIQNLLTHKAYRLEEDWRIAVGFILFELLAILSQYGGSVLLAKVTTEVTLSVRQKLFLKLKQLPIQFFDREPLGRTITRLTSDVEGMEQFFNGTLTRLVIAVIKVFGVFVAMLATDLDFGLGILLACVPALYLPLATKGKLRECLHVIKRKTARLNAKLAEFINGMGVIRFFGLEKWSFEDYEEGNRSLYKSHLILMNWNSFVRPVTVMLCSIPTLVIIVWGGMRIEEGALTVAVFVAFLRFSERFLGPIRSISQEIQVIQDALASSERVSRLLSEPSEAEILGRHGNYAGNMRGDLEFRGVWMSYDPGKPVLKDVSFKIAAGSRVGIVGKTGSGKSTAMALLPALYPFERGEILIDGIPQREWDREALRRQIGLVNQDVEIFRGSLRDNLLVHASGSVSDARLEEVCRQCELLDFVERRPERFDYLITDRGQNLSMGERQLIAFARILLRDPPLLILDEATANIDPKTEERLQRVLAQVSVGRTCFIIAHRLSTIRSCLPILVFEDGELKESGGFEELVARGGIFARLCEAADEFT